ncbi:cysteine protease [Vermiconidia calcicola]|uniref:Cysteine protease n=1 Tax=Vermiconidia calcicola TaxID=1690605 RepID=A0ACC3MSM1_9PEZI|nr:cysteine protease [Vermiconidia calcicola]
MSLPSKDLEELKSDAERLDAQLLRSSSKDEALEVAIKAAETSMRALKLAQDPIEKSKLSTRVKQMLEEAERIKMSTDWRKAVQHRPSLNGSSSTKADTVARARTLQEPQSTRKLPNHEQILLLRASYLNGFKFPPWTTPPESSEFELKDGESLFLDTPELPLSEFQEDVLDDWKRPPDALPPPSWFPGDRTNLGPAMSFTRSIDLVQDAATDCSVVASLCAGVARAAKGHNKILRSVLHPYDATSGHPLISKNGKYVVRLNFNGCYRRVVVDDRLPTSSTSRIIHVVDRHNPGLLWPALIEKAYLKVRGGYDFPGSNSGTDLWILTGWVPEQVFLQADEMEPDRFWERIWNAFNYGDVLITMGTGKMSCRTERELGLAGEHDYAVLDLKVVDGQRLFLIKNPWCEGTSWKGKLKGGQPSLNNGDGQSAEFDAPLIDLANTDEPVQNSRDLMNADDQLSPGTFWMDIDNVIQYFESIYLNWNPGLFTSRQDMHFAWDLSPPDTRVSRTRGRFASLSRHPQFTVTMEKGGILWILLWRHFQNAVPADATVEEIEADRYGIELSGHVSLNAFSSGGHRVLLLDSAVEKGWFVDSPQTLLKLECKPGETHTLVPAEQELPAIRHTFTISAFSNSKTVLAEASARYQHATTCSGSWVKGTAGGNAHSPTYSRNPQFSIAVPYSTSISLLLESMTDELNVHFKLVHSKGQRIHAIRNRDIVFDSKDYRRGCCTAECAQLEVGQYTIICSTFEPQQLGDFTLLVESNQPVQVVALPREGAGRVRLELSAIAFKQGQSKIAAPLVPRRLAKLYAIARYLDVRGSSDFLERSTSSNRSLIRMSIELGRGPERRILMASNGGEYSDSAGGIRTEDLDLQPDMRCFGEIWIVLDRLYVSAEGREERLSVELYVDQPDAVSCGVWRDFED